MTEENDSVYKTDCMGCCIKINPKLDKFGVLSDCEGNLMIFCNGCIGDLQNQINE